MGKSLYSHIVFTVDRASPIPLSRTFLTPVQCYEEEEEEEEEKEEKEEL